MNDLTDLLQRTLDKATESLYERVGDQETILCGQCKEPTLTAECRPKIINSTLPTSDGGRLMFEQMKDRDSISMALCCPKCCGLL